MRRSPAWLVILLGVALAGCSGDGATTTAGPASLASFELEPFAGDGFTMSLPAAWTVVEASDMVAGGVGEVIEEELAATLESEALAAQVTAMFESGAFKMFAFDLLGSSPGFVDNLNVLVLPRSGLTPEGILSMNLQQMQDYMNATIVESEIQSRPGGQTVFFRYRATPQGGHAIEGLSATVLTADQEWTLTMSATDVDHLEEVFTAMVDSFRQGGE
jgi:hypothetical protein